jgi:hypothetical protein
MTTGLVHFLNAARELAEGRGLSWCLRHDSDGAIHPDDRWDLSALAGILKKPHYRLTSFSTFEPAREAVRDLGGFEPPAVMSEPWIELYKAVLAHDQFSKRNQPQNFVTNVAPAFRILAMCAKHKPPEAIGAQEVQLAFNVALMASGSAKRASTLKALVLQWFDGLRLAEIRPLATFCAPYSGSSYENQMDKLRRQQERQSDAGRPKQLRSELNQRRDEERLPDETAFWELVRIAFTEKPQTFSDAIRLHQFRILILTGMRVGEIATLPMDTLRRAEHLLAGEARNTFSLRHFAEKQTDDHGRHGIQLIEAFQPVPQIFQDALQESISEVLRLTAPLREIIKAQRRSGRLLPDLPSTALVPWHQVYVRLSGMVQFTNDPAPPALIHKYRANHDINAWTEIRAHQEIAARRGGAWKPVKEYFQRANDALGRPITRDARGEIRTMERAQHYYVLVSDAEDYAREHLTTKLPNMRMAEGAGGWVGAEDLLFLVPGRALAEEKTGAIVDVERYFSVKEITTQDIMRQLQGKIFTKYPNPELGENTPLGLNPHSLRHLQNTELFKHDLADTVITKRFNRRSVVQSYHYDHRTLNEHLQAISLPPTATISLEPKARRAYELIAHKRIKGPVVERFEAIRGTEGDDAAFEFLNGEAGALHVTPYGLCLNSFAVEPCRKHLECFNNCSHLVRSDDPREVENLTRLQGRFSAYIDRIKATPSPAPHYSRQLEHAEVRLAAIDAALRLTPGTPVSPDGVSRHKPIAERAAFDG